MSEKNYSSTIMRIAGNVAGGLVSTPHFRHDDGELVAVAVDLAFQIVATVQAREAAQAQLKSNQPY